MSSRGPAAASPPSPGTRRVDLDLVETRPLGSTGVAFVHYRVVR